MHDTDPSSRGGGSAAGGDMAFSISMGTRGKCVRLSVNGRLDALNVTELRRGIDELLSQRPMQVEVDLQGTRMIDSQGLGALVSLYKRVDAYGGKAVVTGLHDQPLAMFRILRLDRLMCDPVAPG
jgi:anti-sigma B factor antagonist